MSVFDFDRARHAAPERSIAKNVFPQRRLLFLAFTAHDEPLCALRCGGIFNVSANVNARHPNTVAKWHLQVETSRTDMPERELQRARTSGADGRVARAAAVERGSGGS